jgi:hypothetical protein
MNIFRKIASFLIPSDEDCQCLYPPPFLQFQLLYSAIPEDVMRITKPASRNQPGGGFSFVGAGGAPVVLVFISRAWKIRVFHVILFSCK